MISGSLYCSLEKDTKRLPSNCASEEHLDSMLENITAQLFCADNDLFKGAALLGLVSVRSCIECYKMYIGVDDYIHGFIGTFDELLIQASIDLNISYDKLSGLIDLYNDDFKTINDYMNKLIKKNLLQQIKNKKEEPRELNYKKDKDALNALMNAF